MLQGHGNFCEDFTKYTKLLTNSKSIQSCIMARNESVRKLFLSLPHPLSLSLPSSVCLWAFHHLSPIALFMTFRLPYFSAVKDIFV